MPQEIKKSLSNLLKVDALRSQVDLLRRRRNEALEFPSECDQIESLVALYRDDEKFQTLEKGPSGFAPDHLVGDLPSYDYGRFKDGLTVKDLRDCIQVRIQQLETKARHFLQSIRFEAGRERHEWTGQSHAKRVMAELDELGRRWDLTENPDVHAIHREVHDARTFVDLYKRHLLEGDRVKVQPFEPIPTQISATLHVSHEMLLLQEDQKWFELVAERGLFEARLIHRSEDRTAEWLTARAKSSPKLEGNEDLERFAALQAERKGTQKAKTVDLHNTELEAFKTVHGGGRDLPTNVISMFDYRGRSGPDISL